MKTRLTGMVILTSALTLGIGGETHIQAPTSNGTAQTGPRIQFADPIFDFGKVGSGEVIRHDFVFTNTGNQLLEIRDVRPSCGCTTTGPYDRQIVPGESGTIPVQFSAGDVGGAVAKTVIVVCNDPTQTNLTLQIRGNIWKPIDVNPAMLIFTVSSDSRNNEIRRVRIVNNTDEAITLSEPQCTNNAFSTVLKAVRPGREFELEVTLFMPLRTTNFISSPITLRTSLAAKPVVSIMAHAMVRPAVLVVPAQLTLPPGPLAAAAQLSVTVRSYGALPLVLSEPTVNAKEIEVRIQTLEPNRQFNLLANFPPGFRPEPGQDLQVRVKTNHPQFPVLTIPILAGHSLASMLSDGSAAAKPDSAAPVLRAEN